MEPLNHKMSRLFLVSGVTWSVIPILCEILPIFHKFVWRGMKLARTLVLSVIAMLVHCQLVVDVSAVIAGHFN